MADLPSNWVARTDGMPCLRCGEWVHNGILHFCKDLINNPPPSTPGPRVPYKCVVCGGIGKVQYDPVDPFRINSETGHSSNWPCKACQGTGMLWG